MEGMLKRFFFFIVITICNQDEGNSIVRGIIVINDHLHV